MRFENKRGPKKRKKTHFVTWKKTYFMFKLFLIFHVFLLVNLSLLLVFCTSKMIVGFF
jgi:hypothetical protein